MAKKPKKLRTADVVTRMVRAAADEVRDTLPAALRDEPDAVHQHRTRVRRLRAVLAGVRNHVDARAARQLHDAYREWGHALGRVRDLEVRAAQAEAALREAAIDNEDAWARLVGRERDLYAVEHERLVRLASLDESLEREQRLADFAHDPHANGGNARKDFRRILKREVRRVRRANRRYRGSLASQHELRKAGRRLRYIAEALGEQAPGVLKVDALVSAGKRVHDALGEQRDALLFIERLRLARVAAEAAGEAVRPYDVLIKSAREQARQHGKGLKLALKKLRKGAKRID